MFLPETKIRKIHPLEEVGVNVEGGGFVGWRFRIPRWKEDKRLGRNIKNHDYRMTFSAKTVLDFIKFSAMSHLKGSRAKMGWPRRFAFGGLEDEG